MPRTFQTILVYAICAYTGVHTLVCIHWCACSGVHTLVCIQWCVYSGVHTVSGVHSGVHTLVCIQCCAYSGAYTVTVIAVYDTSDATSVERTNNSSSKISDYFRTIISTTIQTAGGKKAEQSGNRNLR
jgi:hypothetical protein